jgi:hypothetical protein
MEFRLVVRGALPAKQRGSSGAKHRIRRELHPQLRLLWQQHQRLNDWVTRKREQGDESPLISLSRQYARCGFHFVPLVAADSAAALSLDILILRRDEPFQLFTGTGDIDTRVKTLLDGLRMPQQCSELNGNVPQADEDPFFVLMEDDKLVYELNVTTDRLLIPPEGNEQIRDVHAIIKVKTKSSSVRLLSLFDLD